MLFRSLASWGLLAFLKAADTRQGASFAVKADTDVVTDFAEDYYDENGRIETYDDYYPNSQDYQDDYSEGWLTAAAPNLLEVPGFTGDATAEELLALNPDVVITPKKEAAEAYRQAGVPAVCMLAGEDMTTDRKSVV